MSRPEIGLHKIVNLFKDETMSKRKILIYNQRNQINQFNQRSRQLFPKKIRRQIPVSSVANDADHYATGKFSEA